MHIALKFLRANQEQDFLLAHLEQGMHLWNFSTVTLRGDPNMKL